MFGMSSTHSLHIALANGMIKFFMQIVVVSIMQMIGPISQMQTNSKFYSANPPKRLRREDGQLPHITIQCPVYKEGLTSVIAPTVKSVKAAISTYEMQGGTASIFINDDGMQLIPKEEADARMEFYQDHNIGWVSRPKHNPNPKEGERPFQRKGKFKKVTTCSTDKIKSRFLTMFSRPPT
jgi:hypothetical protein